MKKLSLLFVFLILSACAFASNNATMPTDNEIREAIKTLNIDKSQQEYVFSETKKNLEQMYLNNELPEIEKTNTSLQADEPEKQNPNSSKKGKYGPNRTK